ncbi:MAG: radical SAM protein [Microthrixaceae bacterium]
MLDLDRYHADRSIDHQPFRAACYAPFVGMTFDVHGMVSVCGFTRASPLGRVGEQPIAQMWQGAVAQRMRSAVRQDDLGTYCTSCAEEIAGGNVHGVFARSFDSFGVDEVAPWPTRMEFALSTTCNLQCVMCSGEFSSAIRSQREGLPPYRSRYGDAFLDEIGPFLDRLEQARFLGGEPFLADINFRIWQLMVDRGSTAECNVTTNGTQWSPRVESVLEQLRFSLGVSIDGVTRETVETVRAGASYDRIMENLERFLRYRDRRGTSVSLTFCLMRQNVQEYVDYLCFAEDRGCQVFVNTVRQPPQFSLYHLPAHELRDVVSMLERRRDRVVDRLTLNRQVLIEQIDRLARHLEELESAPSTRVETSPLDELALEFGAVGLDEAGLIDLLAHRAHDGEVSVVRCDADSNITAGDRYLGVPVGHLLGSPVATLYPAVATSLGSSVEVLAEHVRAGSVTRVVRYDRTDGRSTVLVSITRKGPRPHSTTKYGAILEQAAEPTPAVAVTVSPTRR